jgi:cytochrome P450
MATQLADIADINAIPLDEFNVAQPELWEAGLIEPYFDRLRREAPVHYCADSLYGPYWSITKYNDIMEIEMNHKVFSSESSLGGITIDDPGNRGEGNDMEYPMFIAMDPPKHDAQRKTVSPMFAPSHLALLADNIRERAGEIFDTLPIGEEFDFVDAVSIELTTQMLAILFDFPWEDRRKLTRWSDVATGTPESGIVESWDQRTEELFECAEYFKKLWDERINDEPRKDLISMMAHADATKDMPYMEFLGNLILLIVGGNDTTRNSISGGVMALHERPEEFAKLVADPSLIPNLASEIIRWQTPLAHMRRTALEDVEVGGKLIKEGDKVVMWYLSGNRDEDVIEDPYEFKVDRKGARRHLAFGFGVHRCVGNRLAEMQLQIVWEEILKRFSRVEVVGKPELIYSTFVRGFKTLPVILHK